MKTNIKVKSNLKTHEGASAMIINPEKMLRRSVMSCLLFEGEFYEDGESISDRIANLCKQVDDEKLRDIAIEAREQMKLRHIPLFIAVQMARKRSKLAAETIERIIQRADELSEFLSLYWKDGKTPIAAQVKKGLARAFRKFNEYNLAKYNRDTFIKLRDVLFLCHAKPKDREQNELWGRLVEEKLTTPDTWEVALSTGKNKKKTWERLISENKLGGLAFLRNLRNMKKAEVNEKVIFDGLTNINTERILPFRFISAAKHAPQWEAQIEPVMLKCLEQGDKLCGKTILIVDVSGSMYGSKISENSELDRAEVACSLAILVREVCEQPVIYATAGNDGTRIHQTKLVPSRRGFALKDAIYSLCHPLGGGGIFLKQVMDYVHQHEKDADRIIVITDEQDCGVDSFDSPLKANAFGKQNYLINVASYQNGIGYGKWTHIDGWSESVMRYIIETEKSITTN